VAPSTRVAAEVLGWEGAAADAAADAAATLRSPSVGWNSARAAELLVRLYKLNPAEP
jgi:PPE-repeat protein